MLPLMKAISESPRMTEIVKMKYESPTEAPMAMAILIRSQSYCRETCAGVDLGFTEGGG